VPTRPKNGVEDSETTVDPAAAPARIVTPRPPEVVAGAMPPDVPMILTAVDGFVIVTAVEGLVIVTAVLMFVTVTEVLGFVTSTDNPAVEPTVAMAVEAWSPIAITSRCIVLPALLSAGVTVSTSLPVESPGS
jgi:hypothetical protein